MVKIEPFDAAAVRAGYWCELCELGPDALPGVLATHWALFDDERGRTAVCQRHAYDLRSAHQATEQQGDSL